MKNRKNPLKQFQETPRDGTFFCSHKLGTLELMEETEFGERGRTRVVFYTRAEKNQQGKTHKFLTPSLVQKWDHSGFTLNGEPCAKPRITDEWAEITRRDREETEERRRREDEELYSDPKFLAWMRCEGD